MSEVLKSKKASLTLIAMLLLSVLMVVAVITQTTMLDMNILLAAFTGLIGTFNIGQGIADRGNEGKGK